MRTFLTIAWLVAALTVNTAAAPGDAKVLVAYYSQTGHTQAMAEAVAAGARSVKGVDVILRAVAEADSADVVSADAIILGSPVHDGNPAPEMLAFIRDWPWRGDLLKDKLGAAFATGGGISAGEEHVLTSILRGMLVYRMIVLGGPDWESAFGASAIKEGLYSEGLEPGEVHPHFLAKGKALGRRVAEMALRLKPCE